MDVVEGTSFSLLDGTWQKPEVTLNDSDLALSLAEWKFTEAQIAAMGLSLRYQWLSAQGRQLLLVRTLQAKQADKDWIKSEGVAQVHALNADIQKLAAQIRAGE